MCLALSAGAALGLGEMFGVIHAAGVPPSQESSETILKVDLYSTALVLEEFGNVIAQGGSGIVIASHSGHCLPPLSTEQNTLLATTQVEELLALLMVQLDQVRDSLHAYQLSKRGNSPRVMAETVRWGKRGARVNIISPGISNGSAKSRRAVSRPSEVGRGFRPPSCPHTRAAAKPAFVRSSSRLRAISAKTAPIWSMTCRNLIALKGPLALIEVPFNTTPQPFPM